LKFITVVRPHEATYQELMALYQNIHKMAIYFSLAQQTKFWLTSLPHYWSV